MTTGADGCGIVPADWVSLSLITTLADGCGIVTGLVTGGSADWSAGFTALGTLPCLRGAPADRWDHGAEWGPAVCEIMIKGSKDMSSTVVSQLYPKDGGAATDSARPELYGVHMPMLYSTDRRCGT